jgi:predicted nucleic acid-binding protein
VTSTEIVLVDTDVFSALYIGPESAARRGLPVARWRKALAGRRVVISFQTRAEIMVGLKVSNWGGLRITQARARLDAAPVVGVDEQVIEAFAALTADCRRQGHGLQAKVHAADRWVAASAISKALPLLAGDGIYHDAPGLTLLADG